MASDFSVIGNVEKKSLVTVAEVDAQLDIQYFLVPLKENFEKKSYYKPTTGLPVYHNPHLENDVLFQYEGPFQLGSDRNETLRDLLGVLFCVFTGVRKRNYGTVNCSEFPARSRE
jgi:hypothetical protein